MSDFLSRVEAILSGVMNFNPKSRVEKLLMKWVGSVGNIEDLETYDKSSVVAAINEIAESGGGEVKPYTSLKRLGSYIYEVTFDKIPTFVGGDVPTPGACSSYVQGGKLYRNLDWAYSELASFHVICKGFEGVAFSPDLVDGQLSNSAISQLPYRLVDGCNDYGIRVSTHVLFNDWDWVGSGNTPLYKIPYTILSSVKSLDNLDEQLEDILADLYATESLVGSDYLLQFVVTDGVSTYAILPPESSSGSYVVQDISENPKLTNFRWVSDATVARTDLQDRPTGVERWNLMPCDLKDLRFTKAYESTNRLSEFIGIDGTTKDSTDEELTDIYDEAHAIYLIRERDCQTWQTMHSVVYGENGLEHLWVQEDWDKDYICSDTSVESFVIDYDNPKVTDYTNAVTNFNNHVEVKLQKGAAQIPMTGYDANHCFFGGTVSAYLPGGYVIAVYAHIGPNGENYFWYQYNSPVEASGLYCEDAGGYFESTTVMGQLQEIGARLASLGS